MKSIWSSIKSGKSRAAWLNKLLRANLKRADVYRKAFNHSHDYDLKKIFNRNFSESVANSSSLLEEIFKTSRFPGEIKHKTPHLFVNTAMLFTGSNRRFLLMICENTENSVIELYQQALAEMANHDEELTRFLNDQLSNSKAARKRIIHLLHSIPSKNSLFPLSLKVEEGSPE